jgi:flagellar M-ring protein FliF
LPNLDLEPSFQGNTLPDLPAMRGMDSAEDPVDRLRSMIGDRQEETVEILRSWLEDEEENV